MLDRSFSILSNCWCMYELYLSLYRRGQASIFMAFPGSFGITELLKLRETCLALDVNKCSTTKPQEKTLMLAEVRGGGAWLN